MQMDPKEQVEHDMEEGSKLREQGKYAEALAVLNDALKRAKQSQLWVQAVNTLGHRLLVWSHKANNAKTASDRKPLMAKEYGDIIAAFKIINREGLTGQPRALMTMRLGRYYARRGKWIEAERLLGVAAREIGHAIAEYPEYLKHHGLALVMAGNHRKGIEELGIAAGLVRNSRKYEQVHKKVVLCGIATSMSMAYREMGEKQLAQAALYEAEALAKELNRLGYGQRLKNLELVTLKKIA